MSWADILERLKEAAGLGDKQVAAAERRNRARISKRLTVVAVRDTGEVLDLASSNFSSGGMRVEGFERLRPGEILLVSVVRAQKGEDAKAPEEVEAEVRWSRRHKRRTIYISGFQFVTKTREQETAVLRFLMEDCQVVIDKPDEQRTAPRTETKITASVTPEGGQTTHLKVLDLAVGGLMLLSPDPMERGTRLALKIHLSAGETMEHQGTVVRNIPCATLDDAFELGVHFDELSKQQKEKLTEFLARLMRS